MTGRPRSDEGRPIKRVPPQFDGLEPRLGQMIGGYLVVPVNLENEAVRSGR